MITPTDWCDAPSHTRITNARLCVKSVGQFSGLTRHRHVCRTHLDGAKGIAMKVTIVPVDKCTGDV